MFLFKTLKKDMTHKIQEANCRFLDRTITRMDSSVIRRTQAVDAKSIKERQVSDQAHKLQVI